MIFVLQLITEENAMIENIFPVKRNHEKISLLVNLPLGDT